MEKGRKKLNGRAKGAKKPSSSNDLGKSSVLLPADGSIGMNRIRVFQKPLMSHRAFQCQNWRTLHRTSDTSIQSRYSWNVKNLPFHAFPQTPCTIPGLSPTAGLYPRSGINTRVGLCEHQASVLAGTNVLVLYSILVLFRELL